MQIWILLDTNANKKNIYSSEEVKLENDLYIMHRNRTNFCKLQKKF